jgi:hypothetical protein
LSEQGQASIKIRRITASLHDNARHNMNLSRVRSATRLIGQNQCAEFPASKKVNHDRSHARHRRKILLAKIATMKMKLKPIAVASLSIKTIQ